MAQYINLIKLGDQVYNIGMQNALHFEGLALVGTWFSDAACKVAATAQSLYDNDFLYYNAAALDGNTVEVGCVYLPATGTAENKTATSYEVVCVEVTGTTDPQNPAEYRFVRYLIPFLEMDPHFFAVETDHKEG